MEAATATAAGLSEAEAARRLRRPGRRTSRRPAAPTPRSRSPTPSRSSTRSSPAFGAATIVFGNPKDALFLGILVANVAIGTFQEVRAKRALDKLAALVVAKATVVRDGTPRQVPVERGRGRRPGADRQRRPDRRRRQPGARRRAGARRVRADRRVRAGGADGSATRCSPAPSRSRARATSRRPRSAPTATPPS